MEQNQLESHHIWHTYCMYPKVKFESQSPNEQVVLILRAHPITQIPWIFNSVVLLVVLVLTSFLLSHVFPPAMVLYSVVFGLVMIFSYMWFNFLSWFFNVGVITNQRIIDIDFRNLLYKEVNTAMLSKVEEVTSKSSGYLGSLFNYGNVFIETASSQIDIEFDNVPKPAEAVEIINSLLTT